MAGASPGAPPLSASVNLSAHQLRHPHLVDEIADALATSGLTPTHLRLELTESAVMQDVEGAIQTLRRLRRLGVRLAIDDFGTGYSSLAYLKRLPVDALKIDRSFVDRLGHDPYDRAIVSSIVSLARALDLEVTGEGIETAEQLAELRALGCDRGQGYYFGRPLPGQAAEALLDTAQAGAIGSTTTAAERSRLT